MIIIMFKFTLHYTNIHQAYDYYSFRLYCLCDICECLHLGTISRPCNIAHCKYNNFVRINPYYIINKMLKDLI